MVEVKMKQKSGMLLGNFPDQLWQLYEFKIWLGEWFSTLIYHNCTQIYNRIKLT